MNKKTAYHHGSLRRALLDEALLIIAQRGVEGLSLREIAARLGVSHAAPYHHFADKTALIHALAHEGMSLMDEEMARAEDMAGGAPLGRLLAIGTAYVMFSVEHPDYYAAFTAPEMAQLPDDAPQPEEQRGDLWVRLMTTVVECQQAGVLPQGDPVVAAVSLWSLVHGLAELWRAGPLRRLPQAGEGFGPLAKHVIESALGQRASASAT